MFLVVAKQHPGCSLTVECAAGGRVAGVRLSAPRQDENKIIYLIVAYISHLLYTPSL